MKTRRLFAQPDDIIEIVEPSGLPVLRIQVVQGSQGNTQVLAYSQPGGHLHVDLRQKDLPLLHYNDPSPWDTWPFSDSDEKTPR